ncbi:MAG: hypothetical protein R1F54_01570 [Candidatus Zeuxoniibacter abyssi]|nr:MAG: hypothetical protein R1F54_01570 [Candidatus Persebacteraceae bacterium AB1(2)]
MIKFVTMQKISHLTISAFSRVATDGVQWHRGGVNGRYVNDGIPNNTKIFKAEMGDINDRVHADGTESDWI